MVYSQEWVNGNIRGNLVAKLPKSLLLLCLVSKRFAKAGELLLSGLVRDFEVYNLVKEALKKWDLDDEFRRVRNTRLSNCTSLWAMVLGENTNSTT